MKTRKIGFKNIISFLLAVCLFFSTLLSGFFVPEVKADSNDVRKAMINFFKGNQITDIEQAALSDPNTLRFLSLFISNFYVPFSTTLDDEDVNGTKDAIVLALVSQCNFSQETAETLVELCYQYTLSTAKPLYVNTDGITAYNHVIGGSIGLGKVLVGTGTAAVTAGAVTTAVGTGVVGIPTIVSGAVLEGAGALLEADSRAKTRLWDNSLSTLDDKVADGKHFNCTADKTVHRVSYGVFLELMAQCDNAPIYWADDEATAISKKEDADYLKEHTVWNWNPSGHGSKVDGKMDTMNVTIADLDTVDTKGMGSITNGADFTVSIEGLASIGSYLLCANNLNYSSGYGNAFMLYTLDMDTVSKMKLGEDAKKVANDPNTDAYKVCAMTAPLYVDWVGNIIVDTGFCRYIVVPACQNPYAWSSVSDKNPAGTFINGNTLFALSSPNSSINNKSTLTFYNPKNENGDTDSRHYDWDEEQVSMGFWLQLNLGNTTSPTLLSSVEWKQYVGSTSSKIDNKIGIGKGDGYDLLSAMYYNLTATSTPNDMYADGVWLLPLLASEKISGYHIAQDGSNTAYLGMVSIGEDCDVDSCAGGDGNFVGKLPAFATVLYADHLNSYEGTGEESDTNVLKLTSFIKHNGDHDGTTYKFGNSGYNKIKIGTCDTIDYSWAMENKFIECIYLTYLTAYTYGTEGATDKKIDLKFEANRFPKETGTIDWGTINTNLMNEQDVQEEITSFIYYFLHPSKGVGYIASWVKTKLGGVFLSWHSDIVGGGSSNASTGMTSYLGFSSYTTLPNLYDIDWIASLLNAYNSIIIFLIVIISVVLCCYIIVGSMTLQRGLFGVLLFGLVAFLPPIAITSVTDTCNRLSDQILSNKFEYWALVQHQTYLHDLYEASATNDKDLYAAVVLKSRGNTNKESQAEESVAGYSGVKLKWMSPKKENYLANVAEEVDKITSNNTLKSLFYNMISPSFSNESFVDKSDSLYLYRDYVDITNYAMKGYNLYTTYYGGKTEDDKKVARTGGGVAKMDIHEKWQNASSSTAIHKFTYPSGLSFREMVLRNVTNKYSANRFSLNDDLYGCTSVFALKNGFINNPSSQFSDDIIDGSNLNYYNTGSKSNLHINLLLNNILPYNRYMSSFDRLEEYFKNNKPMEIDLGSLYYFSGAYDPGAGGRLYYSSFGLDPHDFSFGLSSLNKKEGTTYTKDNLAHFYYGLYSESPYYYWSWLLQDNLNASGLGYRYTGAKTSYAGENYVNSLTKLLLNDNQSFFYNYAKYSGNGYGELKDFMNMHDLFYYVIPILQDGSNLADFFDKRFGIEMYEDMPLEIAPNGNVRYHDGGQIIEIDSKLNADGSGASGSADALVLSWFGFENYVKASNWTEEQITKFWHNYEVITILESYTAWTDTMYDCSYAEPEKITIGNSTFLVDDPLDPTSYFALDAEGRIVDGRYMVFSRSEMAYYGLEEADLTSVELKIIKVQDRVYKDCITLMNYSNFDDDVVLGALAMDMLFAFNKEFSEVSLAGEGHIMYPTGYELKAFTYDAYMRLILSEATGEDLMSASSSSDGTKVSGNIYERILSKTSLFFAIFLVVLDIIVTYVIPLMRLLFIIFVFLLSIIVIASEAFKLELNIIKVTWKALLCPLLSFGAISVGLSLVNSLFMSNGNEGVIEGGLTISLGDPTMTVIAMLLLNIVVTILYWKVLSTTFANLKKFAKALATSVAGTVVGAVGTVATGFMAGKAGVEGLSKLAAGGVAGARGIGNAINKLKNSGGSGVSSSADQRGKDNTGSNPKANTGNNSDDKPKSDKNENNSYNDKVNQGAAKNQGAANVGLAEKLKKSGSDNLELSKDKEYWSKQKDAGILNRTQAWVGAKKNKIKGTVQSTAGSALGAINDGKDAVIKTGKKIGNDVKTTVRNSKVATALLGKSGSVWSQRDKALEHARLERTAQVKSSKSNATIRQNKNSTAQKAKQQGENFMREKHAMTKQKSRAYNRNGGGSKKNKKKNKKKR